MKNKKNIGKWSFIFFATLVIPFLIFVIIPLFLGFPPYLAPLLGGVGVFIGLSLYKKFTKYL
jgi:hypothetical protein